MCRYMKDVLERLKTVFSENGILVDDCEELLINYIPDSLTFINLIICIEEEFDIELPDEFMSIQNLGTAKNLAERIKDLIDDL